MAEALVFDMKFGLGRVLSGRPFHDYSQFRHNLKQLLKKWAGGLTALGGGILSGIDLFLFWRKNCVFAWWEF
jgi:prolipoprotein diacylglyceryltransferase